MIDISLLGTGGMMPLPDRALTSLYIRYNGKAILVDCGEGTQTAIRRTCFNFKPVEAILLTHLHADHVSGLPGFLLSLGNESKDSPVTIYGPRGTEKTVRALLTIAPEISYEIKFCELDTTSVSHFECIGLGIDSIPLNHGIPCLGYHFELKRRGKFNQKRAVELGIPVGLWGLLQNGEYAGGFSPEDVLGPKRKSIRLLYATDTRPTKSLIDYGRNCDLMILEGMYGDPEKQERAKVSMHMTMQEAATIASDAGADELWFTHYSPSTHHPEEYREVITKLFPNTVFGTDSMMRTLKFKD